DRWGVAGYMAAVKETKTAAAELADFLAKLEGPGDFPSEVLFVAHSLGTRVALEVTKILSTKGISKVVVSGACLMASAVPTEFVEAKGCLCEAAASITKSLVLFSSCDPVLRMCFPAGQWLAERTRTPAIGSFGAPSSLWRVRR